MRKQAKSLIEAINYFSDPDLCIDYVAQLRLPTSVVCPTCGSSEVKFLATKAALEVLEQAKPTAILYQGGHYI